MEMKILEEENDVNVQQKLYASTCSGCNKDAKINYISCSECHVQIHYRCTFLTSHQPYSFVEKKREYRSINCSPAGLVDLLSGGVDVLINYIKVHLVEIETLDHLPSTKRRKSSIKGKIFKINTFEKKKRPKPQTTLII